MQYDVEFLEKVSLRFAIASVVYDGVDQAFRAPMLGAKRRRFATVDSVSRPLYSQDLTMTVSKIQIGQLWKKNGTRDVYLVTRMYSEALSTMVVMRKSGAEEEAFIRVKVERTPAGQTIPGFTPAVEE